MPEINEALRDFNPWWKREFTVEFRERDVYTEIRKFMHLRQIIAVTGLRRVGKTTLMLKLAEDAIADGIGPRNIIYLSFDEFRDVEVRTVIKEYEKLMEKNIRDGEYLLLLDEIQKLSDWENQIKTIYDTFGKNIKIILSGSESLFIKQKSKETLAGRIFEFKVEQLSFREFLAFKETEYEPIGLYERELSRLFNEYTLTLGFPELVGVKEKDVIRKYIQENIIEKVVYRDIQQLFNVRDISLVESLMNILIEEPGQLLQISDLAKELKISRQTLSNYLTYLEESFLVKKLYNFSRNRRKAERKLKKYYPAVISTNLLFKEDSQSKSKVFEWLAVNQLKAEFFWRDPYKNEVDVVKANQKILPIEIKYGKTDDKGLIAFMEKFKADEGIILSADKEEERKINGKKISTIPAFKYLLSA